MQVIKLTAVGENTGLIQRSENKRVRVIDSLVIFQIDDWGNKCYHQLPPASAGGNGHENKSRALAQRNTIRSKPIGLKPTVSPILHPLAEASGN